jgi:hypothetical protein
MACTHNSTTCARPAALLIRLMDALVTHLSSKHHFNGYPICRIRHMVLPSVPAEAQGNRQAPTRVRESLASVIWVIRRTRLIRCGGGFTS